MKRRKYGPAEPQERRGQATPKIQDLEKDQVLHWQKQGSNGRTLHMYAIVRGPDPGGVGIAPVFPTDYGTKCYDEGGSGKADKDNVLLGYSSGLFAGMYEQSVRGCYAVANNEEPLVFSQDRIDRLGMDDMDGIVIDPRESRELDDHPWREELQRQRPVSLAAAVSTDAEPEPEPRPTRRLARQAVPRGMPPLPSEPDPGDGYEPEY